MGRPYPRVCPGDSEEVRLSGHWSFAADMYLPSEGSSVGYITESAPLLLVHYPPLQPEQHRRPTKSLIKAHYVLVTKSISS